jgi:hypothetical protein
MPDPVFPPLPEAPTGADAQQWRDYIERVQAYNYAVGLMDARVRALVAEKHAQAQADTAAAMNAAAEASKEAALTMLQPVPRMPLTRAELAWDALRHMPHITGMTDLQQVDVAVMRADAFLRRFPPSPTA